MSSSGIVWVWSFLSTKSMTLATKTQLWWPAENCKAILYSNINFNQWPQHHMIYPSNLHRVPLDLRPSPVCEVLWGKLHPDMNFTPSVHSKIVTQESNCNIFLGILLDLITGVRVCLFLDPANVNFYHWWGFYICDEYMSNHTLVYQ